MPFPVSQFRLAFLALLACAPAFAAKEAKDAQPPKYVRDATGGAAPQKFTDQSQHAVPDASGGVAPQHYVLQPATQQEMADPNIGRPVAPSTICNYDLTLQEAGNLKEHAHVENLGKNCLPQQDAFKQASEAAAYLANYQMYFSDYATQMQDPVRKKEIQNAVQACISGDPKCNADDVVGRKMRKDLLAALVQSNFGKDLKAATIESASRAERMKSMDLYLKNDRSHGPGAIPTKVLSWKGSVNSSRVTQNSFRLDPNHLFYYDPDKASAQEKLMLGKEFNNTFDSFVNEYTSSTGQQGPKARWHYVEAKTSAFAGSTTVAAYDNNNLDLRQGKSAIDKGSLASDVKTQENPHVQEIIASYKKQYKDVIATPTIEQITEQDGEKTTKIKVDAMQAAYQDTGFGLPRSELQAAKETNGQITPKEIAATVIININRLVTNKEKEIAKNNEAMFARMPSSAKPGQIVPSITVDMKRFDAFLNEIWPGGSPPPPKTN